MKWNNIKYNGWFWVAMLLLVVNISAVVTAWSRSQRIEAMYTRERSPRISMRSFLQDEAALRPEQMENYREGRMMLRGHMMRLREGKASLYRQMVDEIMQKEPDMQLLYNLVDSLQVLNRERTDMMVDHMLEIKRFTPEEHYPALREKFNRMLPVMNSEHSGRRFRNEHRRDGRGHRQMPAQYNND